MEAAISVLKLLPLLLILNQAKREDRKDREQLRAEESRSNPELSDFFCSLAFFANGFNYCFLRGKYTSLANRPLLQGEIAKSTSLVSYY